MTIAQAPVSAWDDLCGELGWLPGGRLNLAHEAIDRHAASETADAAALIWEGGLGEREEYTFAEMKTLSDRFASVLRNLGVVKGDRVFVLLDSTPELFVAFLGALKVGAIEAHRHAFEAALPLLATAVPILATMLSGPTAIGDAELIVVFVLFLLYQTAVASLGRSLSSLAAAVPALSLVRPLLAEPPETHPGAESVDALGGDIAFDRVSFSYRAEGPPILEDVSIRARAGEFVAIAGESGAGKSTLLRLALALERPTSGSIYFDGRDLQHLDPRDVRRHIGVVPQMVELYPQDLWDNIVGDHDGATAEDTWRAARLACLDREISAMPMGMLTPVGAGAPVTSGGESQRIRIASALIRNPRILLLDEATNWLDNETQSEVMENLASLTSTRIVIAHRLSTLRRADRIYVMQDGRVVQEGSFEELAEVPGLFREMVRRQVA